MNYPSLDPTNWREEKANGLDVGTFWDIPKNDKDAYHKNDYPGQFVAQIPRYFIHRFTQPGDVVFDPMMGRGTAGIEAIRMGRTFYGCDLNADLVARVDATLTELNQSPDVGHSLLADDVFSVELPPETMDLTIWHPPYLDAIRFSEDERDMSNMSAGDFLARTQTLGEALWDASKIGGHLVTVVGDVWLKNALRADKAGKIDKDALNFRDYFPLAFYTMHRLQMAGWTLRGVVVKNMSNNTQGKGGGKDENLWYFRSLKNGTFRFSHEYIFLFKKYEKGQ